MCRGGQGELIIVMVVGVVLHLVLLINLNPCSFLTSGSVLVVTPQTPSPIAATFQRGAKLEKKGRFF